MRGKRAVTGPGAHRLYRSDVLNPLLVFEEMQAARKQSAAQWVHELRGKRALPFPCVAHSVEKPRLRQLPACAAGHFKSARRLDLVIEIMLAEVRLDLGQRRECFLLGRDQRFKHRFRPRLLLPSLHRRRIAHDLDLALEIRERHPPAEALIVKLAQSGLIPVMIGGTQQRSRETASRDIGEVPFRRFAHGRLLHVILPAHRGKRS